MSVCEVCGAVFQCGMVDGVSSEPCWCVSLPSLADGALPVPDAGSGARCFCPACLRQALAKQAHLRQLADDGPQGGSLPSLKS